VSKCVSENNVCIIGYPWDWNTAGDPGARYAPSILRKYLYEYNIISLDKNINICDLGDVKIAPGDPFISERRFEEALDITQNICKRFIVLGGDHSLTKIVIKNILKKHDEIDLLIFDAHLDMRRLSEGKSSGTYLREVIEEFERRVNPIVIGYREHSNPMYMIDYAKERGVKLVDIDHVKKTFHEIHKEIMRYLKSNNIYISIDADVLDPSQCPGVNSISPDGLFLRELREMLRNIISIQGVRILGADIVEIVPKKDLGDLCIRNMALITLDLIKYFITSG